jgi:hypothetical protein
LATGFACEHHADNLERALRSLLHRPGAALAVVLTLALGIGTNSTCSPSSRVAGPQRQTRTAFLKLSTPSGADGAVPRQLVTRLPFSDAPSDKQRSPAIRTSFSTTRRKPGRRALERAIDLRH